MTTQIKWTYELRVSMYKAVISVLGHPDDVPRGSRGKPLGMSKANYIDTLDSIGVLIGVGEGKGGALSNQIAWITCTPSPNCHSGHWNNRYKNLAAADEAGYFYKVLTSVGVKSIYIQLADEIEESTPSIFKRAWNSVKSWFS